MDVRKSNIVEKNNRRKRKNRSESTTPPKYPIMAKMRMEEMKEINKVL